jgi:hypothetical protein
MAALAAHAWLFSLLARQSFRLSEPAVSFATTATPVELVAPIPPAMRKTPPRQARRERTARPQTPVQAVIAPREVITAPPAPATVVASAQSQRLIAGGLAPPSPLGGPAGDDAGGQAAAGQTYPINPGYWKVVERWLVLNKTEFYCVEPQNIARFMAAPCNHIYHCDYPVQMMSGDSYSFEGVISRPGERYKVHGAGRYSSTSLHLSVTGFGHWHLAPFVFTASLDGEFLGADCPADAKKIHQK